MLSEFINLPHYFYFGKEIGSSRLWCILVLRISWIPAGPFLNMMIWWSLLHEEDQTSPVSPLNFCGSAESDYHQMLRGRWTETSQVTPDVRDLMWWQKEKALRKLNWLFLFIVSFLHRHSRGILYRKKKSKFLFSNHPAMDGWLWLCTCNNHQILLYFPSWSVFWIITNQAS